MPSIGRTQSWQVRLTVRVEAAYDEALMERIRGALGSYDGVSDAHSGWSLGPKGGNAAEANVVVSAISPGRALDVTVACLADVLEAEAVRAIGLQEAVVVPAWRDERDW